MYSLKFLQSHRLESDFFHQPTLAIAQKLLGKYLVVNQNKNLIVAQITETEAYIGSKDQASHGRFGPTPRTQIMFGPPGKIYIYLIYGLHYLLNIITGPKNYPAGVLIRALKPIQGTAADLSGPAKLTEALSLNKDHLDIDITTSDKVFVCDLRSDIYHLTSRIIRSPRIGINYASDPWRSKKWRFTLIQK